MAQQMAKQVGTGQPNKMGAANEYIVLNRNSMISLELFNCTQRAQIKTDKLRVQTREGGLKPVIKATGIAFGRLKNS